MFAEVLKNLYSLALATSKKRSKKLNTDKKENNLVILKKTFNFFLSKKDILGNLIFTYSILKYDTNMTPLKCYQDVCLVSVNDMTLI